MTAKDAVEALVWSAGIFEKTQGQILVQDYFYDILGPDASKETLKSTLEKMAEAVGWKVVFRVWDAYNHNIQSDAIHIDWRPADDVAG